ncbi:MAG: agmatine deiminase family protein [Myxococcota bacterium]|nr:agmatine deiminase family protein [Myxococcota bacterium]
MTAVRWPAEWEPHVATWLAWPHNPDTWPGRLAAAQREFAGFVRELSFREPVKLLVGDAATREAAQRELRVAGADGSRLSFHAIETDDAWLRDTGPVFVSRAGNRTWVDFQFDAWGGKYPPWERDAAVGRAIARETGLPGAQADFVLEGGSVDGNGAGTLLTTESCLLHPNRGPGRTREAMEDRLAHWLGARRVLWLDAGIAGDDTDGHVDDVARFVAPRTVVAARCDTDDENQAPLAENIRRLRGMCDADGAELAVVELPLPPPIFVDGLRCPASYTNFVFADGALLVPTFGVPQDAEAVAILGDLLPEREVVGVPSKTLVAGLGALHCLSQQEPAAAA